jgi:hypothetical protein
VQEDFKELHFCAKTRRAADMRRHETNINDDDTRFGFKRTMEDSHDGCQ